MRHRTAAYRSLDCAGRILAFGIGLGCFVACQGAKVNTVGATPVNEAPPPPTQTIAAQQDAGISSNASGTPLAPRQLGTVSTAKASGTSAASLLPPPPVTSATAQASAPNSTTITLTATTCYQGTPTICAIEDRINALVNQERAKPTQNVYGPQASITPLYKLAYVARNWSSVQCQRNSIGHDGFPSERVQVYQTAFTATPTLEAENVDMESGFKLSTTDDTALTSTDIETVAQGLFTLWLHSSGHYTNMMGPYAQIGTGVGAL